MRFDDVDSEVRVTLEPHLKPSLPVDSSNFVGDVLFDEKHNKNNNNTYKINNNNSSNINNGIEYRRHSYFEKNGKARKISDGILGNHAFRFCEKPLPKKSEPLAQSWKSGMGDKTEEHNIQRKKSIPTPNYKTKTTAGYRKSFIFRRSSLPDHMIWARDKIRTISPTRKFSSSAPESPCVGSPDIFDFDMEKTKEKFPHPFSLKKKTSKIKQEISGSIAGGGKYDVMPQYATRRDQNTTAENLSPTVYPFSKENVENLYEDEIILRKISTTDNTEQKEVCFCDLNDSSDDPTKYPPPLLSTSNLLKRRKDKKGSQTSLNSISSIISSNNNNNNSNNNNSNNDPPQPERCKSYNLKPPKDSSKASSEGGVGGKKPNRSPTFRKRLAQKFRFTSQQSSETLLQTAIVQQDYESLDKLLESEPNINSIHLSLGATLLHQAILIGDFCSVRILVAKGADVGLKTSCGISPTLLAAQCGHFDIAQFLLTSGANVQDVQNGHQRI